MNELTPLRKHFGEHLEKLGGKSKNLVILDSDLNNSLYSLLFAKSFPERHFSVPQAERAMLSMATGMFTRKKLVWVCAPAGALLGTALDVLRHGISTPNLNIKIILSDTGLSNIEAGTTHTTTEDLAILQSMPNLKILTPADQFELRAMMDFMLTDFGPTVLRICRECDDDIYDHNYLYHEGQPVISHRGEQVCLITAGNMLRQAMKAGSSLASKGLSTQVINLSTLSPLNTATINEIGRNFELVITIEDHALFSGIGTKITEIFQQNHLPAKLLKMGLQGPVESGKYQEILGKYGLGEKNIYELVRENWLQS